MVIDVHTHFVPKEFPDLSSRAGGARWPQMRVEGVTGDVIICGENFRTVPDRTWDGGGRLADMDAADVGRQVLSPMPELFSYWAEPKDARDFCRFLNEDIARLVHDDPDRFSGLGIMPLQAPDVASTELRSLVDLGLVGVEVGSNVNGMPIGHPVHEAFLQEAAALGLVVFVHSFQPAGADRLVGPPVLTNLVGFPSEIGFAAASVITSGLLDRIPDLRIAFSHGGGGLPALLPRLSHGWDLFDEVRATAPTRPSDAVRQLWFDALTYDADALRRLINVAGMDRVMVGSDYPFIVQELPAGRAVAELDCSNEDAALLRAGNAEAFLTLT